MVGFTAAGRLVGHAAKAQATVRSFPPASAICLWDDESQRRVDPVGEDSVLVGEDSVLVGEDSVPVGEDSVPVGGDSVLVGEDSVPVS